MANRFVQAHYFADRISEANTALSIGSADLEKLKDFSLPEIDGLLGTIENSASFLNRKSTELKHVLVDTVSNMGNIIESLLTLTFLYVGIFVIQVIVFPLLSFWFLFKTASLIFLTSVPAPPARQRPSPPAGARPAHPADD
jgi:hypothetical protein